MFPTIPIQIKRMHPEAIAPRYAHPGDRGMDVFATEKLEIHPGWRALSAIGWAIAVPLGYEIQIRPRSGLASHEGLTVLNAPGTIDEYRGEIRVLLINHGADTVRIEPGDAIAQLVVAPVLLGRLVEVGELPPFQRGYQGFGVTGMGAIPVDPPLWFKQVQSFSIPPSGFGDLSQIVPEDMGVSPGIILGRIGDYLWISWLEDDGIPSHKWLKAEGLREPSPDEMRRLLHPGPLEFEEFGNG